MKSNAKNRLFFKNPTLKQEKSSKNPMQKQFNGEAERDISTQKIIQSIVYFEFVYLQRYKMLTLNLTT